MLQQPACMMTSILGGPGKSSKQPLKRVQVVLLLLLIFVVGEFFLQKQLSVNTTKLASCSQNTLTGLPKGDQAEPSVPILANSPTVHEAFGSDNVVHWDNLTDQLAPKGLRTSIDTSDGNDARFMRYGMSPLRNVCIRPNGTIVVVGLSEPDFARRLQEAGEAMVLEWKETYNCTWGCSGAAFEKETPENALWMTGTTTHIIPYLGNVFHHFAERVWPLLTGFRDPPDEDKSRSKQKNYYVHRMHTWLDQAHHNMDRNTFMFQIALLSRLAPPDTRPKFLQHSEHETRPMCFDTLMLSSAASGRMSPKSGIANFAPAMARYRQAAFDYFHIATPTVSLPPRPLRVTLYGRGDASRRRVTNIAQIAHYLRTSIQPPVLVTFIDELLQRRLYNQSLPEVVSLMAQTDIYITPHGANTWATLFMPKRSAVIEILGPCGPGTWISNTIAPALELKHRTDGNPWGERVASPRAGNTTDCKSALETPDFTIDVRKLQTELDSLRAIDGPGDTLPLHWLFNWTRNSY
ncbi:hypothetical protein M758_6G142200 [Ceratodon purpureus]|nr:hypothetical protein M758_6G142200 [Ceratodon purpureus]